MSNPLLTPVPTPEKPLSFILRGAIPALKNNRMIALDENQQVTIPPNPKATKAIKNIKAAVARQIPPEYTYDTPLFREPTEIHMVVLLGVYYQSALPISDVDNAVTTVQEALQNLIYENDRQVAGTYQERVRFRSRESLHTRVFLWVADPHIALHAALYHFYRYQASHHTVAPRRFQEKEETGVDWEEDAMDSGKDVF